ncbi:hypothetical protein ACFSL4_25460 [Streptomyces caeni]|uniref:Secreted protein n=1 Tax=Streptomyces caeni TaxID=2307231 RepID=A0ABW4IVN0_9ACTN
MPRGRHRHSPPLHRLLPPSAIAGVSVVCAVGPWLSTEPLMLRALAAGAAVAAVVGAVVMRRWDAAAGKQVADLVRARAGDEWRHEERVAELETDLEESRELRTKLEQKLRAKRAELAKLRNEHAALLRRYATAETERASALEGRRLLEIEATTPARALPAGGTPAPAGQDAPDPAGDVTAGADVRDGAPDPEDVAAPAAAGRENDAEPVNGAEPGDDAEPGTSGPQVFSPAGSALFLRADSALTRLIGEEADAAEEADAGQEAEAAAESEDDAPKATASAEEDEGVRAGAATDGDESAETSADAKGQGAPDAADAPQAVDGAAPAGRARGGARRTSAARAKTPARKGGPRNGDRTQRDSAGSGGAEAGVTESGSGEEGGPEGQPPAADGREHAAAPASQQPQPAVSKPAHTTGHFTVPTAVAVVPPAPRRRPAVEGGFDFFGTQKPRETGQSVPSVQNEDLADVVGQEALAVHKAESESGFKPVDPQARAVGQVIDLTAHDETEQIDVEGLRTAAS